MLGALETGKTKDLSEIKLFAFLVKNKSPLFDFLSARSSFFSITQTQKLSESATANSQKDTHSHSSFQT